VTSILLVRHGPVDMDAPRYLNRDAFIGYMKAYEHAGLRQEPRPPNELVQRVQDAGEVFASPTWRARESLKLLHPERNAIVDNVFAEDSHAIPNLAGHWPFGIWFILLRGMHAFHPGLAAVRQNRRQRAELAASLLVTATERGPVALIGHSWFNRTIAQALTRRNWRRVYSHRGFSAQGREAGTWGHMIYQLNMSEVVG
jgi:hypothetical protein